MRITSDFHIHTHNSFDAACMSVSDIIDKVKKNGICDFGIADHLNTPYNIPDIDRSRKEYDANNPSEHFHFGVEVSCVSQWELDEIRSGNYDNPVMGIRQGGPAGGPLAIGLVAEDIEKYGIEYVIGGAHWPLYVPLQAEAVINCYHRQNMFLATHELVNIVAHPWWWAGHWKDSDGMYRTKPWLDDFRKIPKSMHAEFAAACVENGTIVEINLGAIILKPTQPGGPDWGYPEQFIRKYLDYLSYLKSLGVKFSMGSDCHVRYEYDFPKAEQMLESVGIEDTDIWVLPPRQNKPGFPI